MKKILVLVTRSLLQSPTLITVSKDNFSEAMHLSLSIATRVNIPILETKLAHAVLEVLFPLSIIRRAIGKDGFAPTMLLALFDAATVSGSVFEPKFTLSMLDSFVKVAYIDYTGGESKGSLPMEHSIFKVAFVMVAIMELVASCAVLLVI